MARDERDSERPPPLPRGRSDRREEEPRRTAAGKPLSEIGKIPRWVWVLIAGLVSFTCIGVVLNLRDTLSASGKARKKIEPDSDRLKVEISPELQATGVRFGEWKEDFNTCSTVASLPPQSQTVIHRNTIKVRCVGHGNVKFQEGFSSHPTIKAGESVKLTIYLGEQRKNVAVATLSLD